MPHAIQPDGSVEWVGPRKAPSPTDPINNFLINLHPKKIIVTVRKKEFASNFYQVDWMRMNEYLGIKNTN